MKRARTVLVLFLAAIPSLVTAQRGMGGVLGRGGMGGMGGTRGRSSAARGDREPAKFPEAKDLQKFNPAALLLDRGKKLSLSDTQTAALTKVRRESYERSSAVLVRYDSVRREYKPVSRDPRDKQSAWTDSLQKLEAVQLRALRTRLDTLQNWRRDDVQRTLALFVDEKQKLAAAELIDKQEVEFLKLLPSQAAERGGRGRGGRP